MELIIIYCVKSSHAIDLFNKTHTVVKGRLQIFKMNFNHKVLLQQIDIFWASGITEYIFYQTIPSFVCYTISVHL